MNKLKKFDPEVSKIIQKELKRQRETILLIPSENYVSQQILKVEGSILSNKYAEGYPGHKWYSGCRYVSKLENLAIERAKQLFGVEYVNVQPHSGSQANMAVCVAVLNPKDTILSLSLNCGGHLTHGSPVNFSGKYYNIVHYGVSQDTNLIDYDEVRKLAHQYKPKLIITGASSYPRIIDFKCFKEIADEVSAYFLADIAHIAGLIIAGVHPSPVPYADFITTSTHKTLRGPRGGMIMCKKEFGELIDKAVFPGIQGGPAMHIIGAKAVALKEASTPEFVEYQKQIVRNAKILAEELKNIGFNLVTGGTDTHLMLIDLRNKELTGKDAASLLEEVGIIVNKNVIPYDPQSNFITSGIRLGTPALTTRGMKEPEMKKIANMFSVLLNKKNKKKIKLEVKALCKKFPIYTKLK